MSRRRGGLQSESATAFVADVVEHIFEQSPSQARRVGRHDYDGRLPEVAPRSPADLGQMHVAATRHLAALPDDGDPELRADLHASLKWLEVELLRVAELGEAYPDPFDYLWETDVSVYVRTPYAPLEDRVAALGTHLVRMPDFLAEAARTFGDRLPAGTRLRALEQARGQAVEIDHTVAALAGTHPDLVPGHMLDVAAAAADACEELAQRLEKTAPAKVLLGPELLAAFLQAREGIEHAGAELLEEACAEVEALATAADSAAADLGVADRRAAYELVAAQVSPGDAVDALRSTIERVKGFWIEADVVSVETDNALEIRRAPQRSASAAVRFAVSGPLEESRQPHVLLVPDLKQYLTDPMLEVIALHEVFAGHYVHTEAARRGPSVMRTCVWDCAGFSEGWAHYVEALAIEHGIARERPLVEIALLRSALEAATRLLVFLAVHLGRWTFAEAVDRAVRICDWSPARSAREVLVTTSDSETAMYTLGKLRIREWRATDAGTSRGDLKRFHDRLLRCGIAPLSTVHQYLLDARIEAP